MKAHSPELLKDWRNFTTSERQRLQSDPEVFIFGDDVVSFTTVTIPEKEKPFPYAVAAAIPQDIDDYEIAVSDDVPPELRGLWAWHEYNDFKILGHDADLRCLISEKFVLEELNDGSYSQAYIHKYIKHRVAFYLSLAHFIAQDIFNNPNSQYDVFDYQGCYAAIDYLETF